LNGRSISPADRRCGPGAAGQDGGHGGGAVRADKVFAPVSGAHFNPVVTPAYLAAQLFVGALGSVLAHSVYKLPEVNISQTLHRRRGRWLAKALAIFMLLLAIPSAAPARANMATVLGCAEARTLEGGLPA
jgi:hypothetical protein